MLIRIGYEIEFTFPAPAELILVLSVHPSRWGNLVRGEDFRIEPGVPFEHFFDSFGNRATRTAVGQGTVRFVNDAVVDDGGFPDPEFLNAEQRKVCDLPFEALRFLYASRYCEVDGKLSDIAWNLFGSTRPGWRRVQAICDFVHSHLRFDYQMARATRTACEAYDERVGVCRDFMHLAITFCRCMNVPARYCTGYLGNIGVPIAPFPMDFSAWFEVYLGDRWHTFDARHNARRIGRVLMAQGRDAADVALTTIFGKNFLQRFFVRTDEIR